MNMWIVISISSGMDGKTFSAKTVRSDERPRPEVSNLLNDGESITVLGPYVRIRLDSL